MGRAIWLDEKLRQWGCTVVDHDGWQTRGRDTLRPQGVVMHHTATPAAWGIDAEVRLCIDGRPDVDGPLCHVVLARDGVCHLIAAGHANHAGPGGWRGLAGNDSVLGIEACNDGAGEAWPAVQLDGYRRCVAAMLDGIGRDYSWVCAHREWTTRKIDPAGIDMTDFRAGVHAFMEQEGPVTPDDIDKIALKVTETFAASLGSRTGPLYTAMLYAARKAIDEEFAQEASASHNLLDWVRRIGRKVGA